MNDEQLVALAREMAAGTLAPAEFRDQLKAAGIGREYHVDLDRQARCGFPEVIFAEGKSREALVGIAKSLAEAGQTILATRVSGDQSAWLSEAFPDGRFNSAARTWRRDHPDSPHVERLGKVSVLTAGSADMPVAEEVLETLDWMAVESKLIADVGVAGPHRLRDRADELRWADVIVVVAGMEGALPSVVGGYVDVPVIAVPTSVGYGASFEGVAALLGMLNSCAANVVVVNIDGGFKGGYVAGMIARQTDRNPDTKGRT